MRASRLSAVIAFVLAVGMALSGPVLADVNNSTGTNVQSGNNRAATNQGGAGKSGDAVGGQVSGVVSSGHASVDARNTSSNSDVRSGDVHGSNTSASFVGQNSTADVFGSPSSGPVIGDVTNSFATENLQDGNNTYSLTQSANLTTGDGVGGEVIGVVTAAGGSTSVVAANRSDNVDITTGDADGSNNAAAFVGQDLSFCVAGEQE